MTFTFRAAHDSGWLAFVSGTVLLVVEPQDDAFVASAWAAVRTADGFQGALDLLAGNGLSAMPSFALIDSVSGGATRVIVRGGAVVRLAGAAGDQELSGSGVSTWLERSVESVESVSFEAPGAKIDGLELPLESGVVLVAAISSSGAPAQAAPAARKAAAAPRKAAPAVPAPVSAPPAEPPAPAAPAPVPAAPAPAPAPAPTVPAPAPVAPTPAPPAPVATEVDIEATVREPPEQRAEEEAEAPSAEPDGYHDLFGDTMYRDVAEAAVREDEEQDADAPVVDDALHDGETVMLDDIARKRGRDRTPDADVLHDGETVMLSNTGKGRARRPSPSQAPPAPPERPGIVLVVAPSGAREPVTQPILVGRSPSFSQVSGKQMPKLLTIGTADQDISRNHAQFALEGDTLVVTDLHSRNGTVIQLPNKPAQKLRGGEPTAVIAGTVIDFGGGVTITVEEQS